jgi:hypothetical protein
MFFKWKEKFWEDISDGGPVIGAAAMACLFFIGMIIHMLFTEVHWFHFVIPASFWIFLSILFSLYTKKNVIRSEELASQVVESRSGVVLRYGKVLYKHPNCDYRNIEIPRLYFRDKDDIHKENVSRNFEFQFDDVRMKFSITITLFFKAKFSTSDINSMLRSHYDTFEGYVNQSFNRENEHYYGSLKVLVRKYFNEGMQLSDFENQALTLLNTPTSLKNSLSNLVTIHMSVNRPFMRKEA